MLDQVGDSSVPVDSALTCWLSALTLPLVASPVCGRSVSTCVSTFRPGTLRAQELCSLPLAALALWQPRRLGGGPWLELSGAFRQPKWGAGGWRGLVLGWEPAVAAGVGGTASWPSLGAVEEYCGGRQGAGRFWAGSTGQTGRPAGNRAPALQQGALPGYLQAESLSAATRLRLINCPGSA